MGELSATIESHLLLISPRCILCLAYCEWFGGLFVFFDSKPVYGTYMFAIIFDVIQVFETEWTYETCKLALQHVSLAAW